MGPEQPGSGMSTTSGTFDVSLGAVVVAPSGGDGFWPVRSRWRAAVEHDGTFRSPEWALQRARAVPLSSRIERSLLEAVRADDGRAVLERASEPGEHRVAAATVAALRLAEDHPERALRFLGWIRQSPDDPADLRFLRRYLPRLHVLVRLDPELGCALPLGHDALGLLAAERFGALGDTERSAAVLSALAPSAPVALAAASARLAAGDLDGTHALARDRPVVDDVSAALRIVDAAASEQGGDPAGALAVLDAVLGRRELAGPVERMGRRVRARALRAAGREVEAALVDEDLGVSAPVVPVRRRAEPSPEPPLFGRSLTDAMDDAWARVRRQPVRDASPMGPDELEVACEGVVALVAAGHVETAEAELLTFMDRVEAAAAAGAPLVEDFHVLLAGVFSRQGLIVEEVATLERLRSAHRRQGTEPSEDVLGRLAQARVELDALG